MRRFGLLFTCLAIGLMASAESLYSQVSVKAENGWTFTFTGNVNAFWVFEAETDDGQVTNPFAIVGVGATNSRVRTGLLPAFASFEAAGHEGQVDLLVHFGFAPQIQTADNLITGHDNFGFGTGAGAQIDMRQVFMTVSGPWGSILAGRELGLYQRQNILNDQTLFGTGPTGGNSGFAGGTTLGRIGFGYVYPNFNAQLTYSSPSGRPAQFTIGLFDPSTNNDFDEVPIPRAEAEFLYSYEGFTGWVGGMAQYQKDTQSFAEDSSTTAWGGHGGLKYASETFSVIGSGYYGQGIGTTLMFLGGRSDLGSTELRKSYGFIGQGSVTPQGSKVTIAGSYGQSTIENADDEADFKLHNRAIVGGIYYQATPALKVVGEGTYTWSDDDIDATEKNSSVVVSGGLMLFF